VPRKASKRPVRTKQRPKRIPPRQDSPVAVTESNGDSQAAFVQAAANPVSTATAARSATPSTRRSSRPDRKAGMVIDYRYLRRDVMALALLGPTMVVLVIVAYVTLH
jgi:hypothetical protein